MSTCGFQWTTGTGPGDPRDTGIHRCLKEATHNIHNNEHRCACGGRRLERRR